MCVCLCVCVCVDIIRQSRDLPSLSRLGNYRQVVAGAGSDLSVCLSVCLSVYLCVVSLSINNSGGFALYRTQQTISSNFLLAGDLDALLRGYLMRVGSVPVGEGVG